MAKKFVAIAPVAWRAVDGRHGPKVVPLGGAGDGGASDRGLRLLLCAR